MITLRIREKPSNPMNMSQQQNLLLGQRTFYFLVTNWLLKDIDHEIPSCQKKFLCHNINHACSPAHKKIRHRSVQSHWQTKNLHSISTRQLLKMDIRTT